LTLKVSGSLAPSEFLAIAEESRAIIAIDRWVLRRACRDIGRWQAEHRASEPLTLSVNLSSRQFSDPLLVDQIREVLRDTGFDASHLKLEITENSLMENSASVAANVNALRRLGIELYVDDFGTGYSSLTYLRDLPVSALKIDRSFVASMLSDTGSREIVRSVVTLAHNFDLIAIAEGVESVEQMVALRALNCECGQGYLFSEPVNWEDASALIETPFALAL
jgi:EAL domain-containing protein (putative c-di-GMP-specific phosphodiesterase class I)